MKILISNDDGFQSIGSQRLAEILESEGHTVFLALPKKNCSGASSKVHFNTNIEFSEISDHFIVVDGSPVDCVIVGLDYWKRKGIQIDIIMSGINQGMNLGTSRRYSGTLAITYEALAQGYPSLSISSHIQISEFSTEYIKNIIIDLLKKYKKNWNQNSFFGLNINIFNNKNPISYCEETSVLNTTSKLLCAYRQEEQKYSIEINRNLLPIDTNGKSVIVGIVTNEVPYSTEPSKYSNTFNILLRR